MRLWKTNRGGAVGPALRVGGAALAAGLICSLGFLLPPPTSSDFDQLHVAARALLAGDDPYTAVRESNLGFPLFYPLPAVLLVVPLVGIPIEVARPIWAMVGAAALALAAERYERGLYVSLLSAPFLNAVLLGQWSPLITAAAVVPALSVAWAAKPTIGLAMLAAWPSRAAAARMGLIVLVSLAIMPTWPARWAEALTHSIARIPLLLPGGFLLLLPLLRWRHPEARLLAGLACVPQTIGLYELLPIFLIPRRRGEAYALALLTYAAAFLAMLVFPRRPDDPLDEVLLRRWPLVLTLGYMPAILLVMRLNSNSSDGSR